jgi:hypothetical protein
MSGAGKRDLFASLSEVGHVLANNQDRRLGHLTRRSRGAGQCDTEHQRYLNFHLVVTYIEISVEDNHFVIHDASPIAALYKWQEILFWENRFVFHDACQICIARRLGALPGSKVNIDETQRSIVDDHSSDDCAFVSVDPTYTPDHQL